MADSIFPDFYQHTTIALNGRVGNTEPAPNANDTCLFNRIDNHLDEKEFVAAQDTVSGLSHNLFIQEKLQDILKAIALECKETSSDSRREKLTNKASHVISQIDSKDQAAACQVFAYLSCGSEVNFPQ